MKVTGFDHVMNPVVKIINSIRSKAKQHRMFKVLLDEISQVINRLGQEFEDRFCDFEQLESCVSFVANPFMHVDITSTAEQLGALFNLDAGQIEIKILTLQNDLHLKAHQSAPNFWCLFDKEKIQLCMHSSYENCLLFWFNLPLNQLFPT